MAGRRVDSPTKHCYKICIYPCSGPWASCNQPIPHYSGRPDPITIPPAQAYDCSAAATGDVGHRLLRRRRQRARRQPRACGSRIRCCSECISFFCGRREFPAAMGGCVI
ncbi:hypothetical protein PVAP13_8NG306441 [Panicum virgatum]|uniref:Uncharacterized protein n=1 Tax=Panicum virgatum TaxID=38727 RepID=A0A8T0PFI5_PANVG|nr:hypothetical protein PVAP13_8NG306441 [Panicum virgatum]KAG2559399.1 hypothetical protein PVAP13_8NG306441 [Panicum virgatum]